MRRTKSALVFLALLGALATLVGYGAVMVRRHLLESRAIRELASGGPESRRAAAEALVALDSRRALRPLLQQVRSEKGDPAWAIEAILRITRYGHRMPPEDFHEELASWIEAGADFPTFEIARLGRAAVPALKQVLDAGKEDGARTCLRVIGWMRPLPESGEELLLRGLRTPSVRSDALRAALRVGLSSPEFGAEIRRQLAGESEFERVKLLEVLVEDGQRPLEAVRFLETLDTDAVTASLLERLEALSRQSKAIVDGFLGGLDHEDAAVRARAAWLIGKLHIDDDRAHAIVERLLEPLADRAAPVRWAALNALDRFPASLSPHCDKLLPLLDDPNDLVRQRAASAALRAGCAGSDRGGDGAEALQGRLWPLLVGAIADADPETRDAAVRAFEVLGPPPAELLASLVALIDAGNGDARIGAALACGKLGDAAAGAVPALRRALPAADRDLAMAAIDALSAIGGAAEAAVPELVALLWEGSPLETRSGFLLDADSYLRLPLIQLLLKFPRRVFAELAMNLERPSLEDRTRCLRLMQFLGVAGDGVRGVLLRLLEGDGDPSTRKLAALIYCHRFRDLQEQPKDVHGALRRSLTISLAAADDEIQVMAAYYLVQLGERSEAVRDVLRSCISSGGRTTPSDELASYARDALRTAMSGSAVTGR